MSALLVLIGIAVVMIGTPIELVREYRRQLARRRGDDGLAVRRHRLALDVAVIRAMVPGFAIGGALILLGVLIA